MRILSLFLSVAILLCVSSCAYTDYPYEIISGKYFEVVNVEKIIDNTSTEEQVRLLFGDPLNIEYINGIENWRYYVRRSKRSTFGIKETIHTVEQELFLNIENGIVVCHKYTSSEQR